MILKLVRKFFHRVRSFRQNRGMPNTNSRSPCGEREGRGFRRNGGSCYANPPHGLRPRVQRIEDGAAWPSRNCAAGAGLAVGGGTRTIVLTNQKGAVLELPGWQVGLMANADLSGL